MDLASSTRAYLTPARINTFFTVGLILILAVFCRFEYFHLKHDKLDSNKFQSHYFGDTDRKIDRIFEQAKGRANKPYSEVASHMLYRGHNPGLFIYATELAIRGGVTSPMPLLVTAVLAAVAALVAAFHWISFLFKNRVIGLIAVGFLVTTPYLLFHVPSLHTDPFDFFFFNLTLLMFTRYLNAASETAKRRRLLLTWVAYFLLCQSYYMFYVSTFIVMAGCLWLRDGRRALPVLAFLASAPIAAMALVFVQVTHIGDGGIRRVIDMFVARTVDGRIPESRWNENQHFLKDFWTRYPALMSKRYVFFFFFDWWVWALLPAVIIWLTDKADRRNAYFLYFIALGGFSWNLFMLQHSMIHDFSVIYGFFAWAILFAVAIHTGAMATRSANPFSKRIVGGLLLLFLIRGFGLGLSRTFG